MHDAAKGDEACDEGHEDPVEMLRRLRAAGSPITLAINGQGRLEVADEESYQMALRLVDRLETIAGIKEGVGHFEAGHRGSTWEEIQAEIQRTYGAQV